MIERETDGVISDALKKGVVKIITIGIDLDSNKKNSHLSKKYKNVYTTMGFHPHESKKMEEEEFVKLEEMLHFPKNVAVGEIGLDYYYQYSPKEVQRRVFRKQIDLAKRLNLPIIVHDRDAHKDTMNILEEKAKDMKVVLHCFSGDLEMAQWCIKHGFYLGIGGVVTFKNARKLAKIVQETPIKNILLETDSPFMTPSPFRGKPNEPKYIPWVAEKIADLKGKTVSEVGRITSDNANQIFNF